MSDPGGQIAGPTPPSPHPVPCAPPAPLDALELGAAVEPPAPVLLTLALVSVDCSPHAEPAHESATTTMHVRRRPDARRGRVSPSDMRRSYRGARAEEAL